MKTDFWQKNSFVRGLHKQRILKLGDHRTHFPCGFKNVIFFKMNFRLCEPSDLPHCFLLLLTVCLPYCFGLFTLVG